VTPERWRRTEELFHQARSRPAADRAAFLEAACSADDAMRREVESLLTEAESDGGFLDEPALVVAALTLPSSAVMTGRSLGGYQLQALLGAGGMGEVYRAHDPKLGREVAIKILPSAFTNDPDRLARFEREARILASLNHANICGIHGLEQADGIRFLILELVEGETLANILRDGVSGRPGVGALPLDRALAIARQVTDALEAAHDKGIIHRDLKPANIKITPAGVVKVLDFGLAKAVGGEASPADLTQTPATSPGEPRRGPVMGTAAYMSPEQARGLPVDKRTDIWTFGCVLYEMLTGRVAFAGDTVSDSIAKILERDPDWSMLPARTPSSIRRLLHRCLAKNAQLRLRDVGDVRLEIDAIAEAPGGSEPAAVPRAPAGNATRWLPWALLAALATGVGAWEARRVATIVRDPLANAAFSRVTDWEGTEEHAEISPDGRFVAFLADEAGQLDVWVSQLGAGSRGNLTIDMDPFNRPGNLLRSLGFSGDGSEIWFNRIGNPGREKMLAPLGGGKPRPFLDNGYSTPAWSPDNTRVVYINVNEAGDPLYIADQTGSDAHRITVRGEGTEPFFGKGLHTHNPVWSQDSQWIYFVHGRELLGEMDVWRVRPSGGLAERLTNQTAPVNYLAPIDARTVLYVARAEDWSGPWLWTLDVESKVVRRATTGLERYTFVSASRDGRRVVATVANPTSSLWSVPLLDRLVDDHDAQPYPMPSYGALAPRFGGASLFYLSLSSRGNGDGLWRVQNDQAFEVRKGADGVLAEPPAPSPDGSRVAVVVRQQGKRRLAIMSADGTNARTLAPSVALRGVEGQGAADWSPDGKWIVTGGDDGSGPGLFKIPVDGGAPERLVTEDAVNPVWSPTRDLIVFAVPFGGAGGFNLLRAVRPDGAAVAMPEVRVRRGGAHRFLPDGRGLVYLQNIESKDFWFLDMATMKIRQLTLLSDRGFITHFDVTPDGKHLVFDRSRQNSNIVLIELPGK
jgi:Tol biopolymer transport system component